jgi:hypothetical protein
MTSFRILNNKIPIRKEITELDTFVLELVQMIQEYCKYVIISGYVAIFFGRSRATEDVDMFIEQIPYDIFEKIFNKLTKKGYELNEDNPMSLYEDYLKEGTSINIWKKEFPLLRLEIKFARKSSQIEQLKNPFEITLNDNYKLYFSQIEAQIAYKRYIANSEKDLKDARHLEITFDNLDKDKIEYYKNIFMKEFKNEKK